MRKTKRVIPESLKSDLDKCETMDDLMGSEGLVSNLVKNMVNYLMEKELENKLGYPKNAKSEKDDNNRRNGSSKKTVRSSFGDIELETPRDRNGEFDPTIVKKYQKDISLFDDKIISMYGKGMTTRDIQSHLDELYGVSLSAGTVSNITDKVIQYAQDWQSRPLEALYAVIFFDAVHYKVRENGHIVSKAAYICLGITMEGKKDVLGIWVGENEGAKYWLRVCIELKNRGVKDILIACMDGLKGLPEAIKSVFPLVDIQLCIIHMIRNSMKFVPYKHSKEFTRDLKQIYTAPTEASAQAELENLISKWDQKYPLAVKPWVTHWDNLITFLKFSAPIRKMIYTTNALEGLNRQLRKVSKNRSVFPTDDSLLKLLYLAVQDISKKWTMPLRDWKLVIAQLSIHYHDRLDLVD